VLIVVQYIACIDLQILNETGFGSYQRQYIGGRLITRDIQFAEQVLKGLVL
jgi:hypothetical protein